MYKVNIIFFLLNLILINGYTQNKRVKDLELDTIKKYTIDAYVSIYSAWSKKMNVDIALLNSIFAEDGEEFYLENDYNVGLSIYPHFESVDSYTNVWETAVAMGNIRPDMVKIDFPLDSMYFCKTSTHVYVWLDTEFAYFDDKDSLHYIKNWLRLKIGSRDRKIEEVKYASKPVDKDNDHIADSLDGNKCDLCNSDTIPGEYNLFGRYNLNVDGDELLNDDDSCRYVAGPKRTCGCPDTDNDGVPDKDDELDSIPGAKCNRGCPIGELILQIDAGYSQPWSSPYADNQMLSSQSFVWSNKTNLAKGGNLSNLALQYHFARNFGVGIGVMSIINTFNSDRLRVSIEAYLLNKNQSYSKITASKGKYRFIVPYIKACTGTYQFKHHVLKLDLLAGYGINRSNNSIDVEVTYTNDAPFRKSLSLKVDPFLVAGATFGYEYWIKPSKFGVAFGGYYLNGAPKIGYQQFQFSDSGDLLYFEKRNMQLWGASCGLVWTIFGKRDYFKNRKV